MNEERFPRILIGCTGSVASIKVPQLAKTLMAKNCEVLIIPTCHALHFIHAQALSEGTIPGMEAAKCLLHCASSSNHVTMKHIRDDGRTILANVKESKEIVSCVECEVKALYPDLKFVTEQDEWSWEKRDDPVKHIQLRDWADLLLIAPLDANTLAKMAQGLCDNLLTCIIRAWDMDKPLFFCPAMNVHMYNHPFTNQHKAVLKNLGYHEIEAISKKLMCGDIGIGAMAEIQTILETVIEFLNTKR